jgi:hypothetical protein
MKLSSAHDAANAEFLPRKTVVLNHQARRSVPEQELLAGFKTLRPPLPTKAA